NNLSAWTGGSPGANSAQFGGAGSIVLKGPGATFGDLTINNNAHGTSSQATELPSLGSGTAQAGSSGVTLVTNRATNIPLHFIGTACAVSDPDKPVTVTPTNTTSNNTYPVNANADASFTIAVQGNVGETITLKAKDANLYPLESPVITVGTLATGTPTATQI